MRPLVVFRNSSRLLNRASMVASCTNVADCFWLNLFTAQSHGHLLCGSYMALFHHTYQIYNSGIEDQGFPSRLVFFRSVSFSMVSVMRVAGERWF